jgi:N-glycosylase/DNA lyase
VITNYKSNLKEFENSFVELKSQLNEMQTFNGKLAYANKLLTKGGLTNDEKIRIAEEFDKCATVEDAKKLYNKIISENKFSSKSNTDKLKSVKPSTAAVQNLSENKAEKLFESEERRRMKMLAGIVKPNN